RKDKHRNAFAVLSSARGRRMGELLAIEVTTDRACLNCHSVVDRTGSPAPVRTQQFDRKADGVSCVVCHGAFREWVFEHTAYEDPRWRGLSRKDKERRYGMVDLWDPVTRAK